VKRLVLCLAILVAISNLQAVTDRQHDSFDFGWRFHLGDASGAEQPAFSDSSWRTLDVPHDWSIEGTYDQHAPSGGYLPTGIGWYRKSFNLPESERGRRVRVQFDGVYQKSTVWINGYELGQRPDGYSNFGGTVRLIAKARGLPEETIELTTRPQL
jgi:beta-galactosidase